MHVGRNELVPMAHPCVDTLGARPATYCLFRWTQCQNRTSPCLRHDLALLRACHGRRCRTAKRAIWRLDLSLDADRRCRLVERAAAVDRTKVLGHDAC